MAVKCRHCGAENAAEKFCRECGQPLPKVCARCGAPNEPDDRFCAGCGGPLQDQPAVQAPPAAPRPVQAPMQPPVQTPYAPQPQYQQPPYPQGQYPQPQYAPPQAPGYPPAAAYVPQPGPQPMPYAPQPAQPKKPGWIKWVSIISSIVVVLVGVVRLIDAFSGDDGGGGNVKVVAKGSLGAKADFYDSNGPFVASGQGSSATLYMFDQKGTPQKLNTVNDTAAGNLVGVSVGDMYNNGNPVMVAYYEKKVYIAGQTGESQSFDVAAKNVLIGDFDGDGKNETIFVGIGDDGKDEYMVWRYSVNQGESQELVTLGGRTAPELFNAQVKSDKKSLLLGYTREGGLQAVLYSWDNVAGPRVFGQYPIEEKEEAPAHWVTAGQLNQGQVILISYGGEKPAVEVRLLQVQGARSLGTVELDGQGEHAVTIGTFTGKTPQILAVDEKGSYFIYEIGK